ncbi:type 2 periplasmic-binding domain-containing protein [Paraburkholderia diazotrophica]|uniref:Uncharacterized protein n=1 Tax=Paraburkholderia diazotrophica TaxID=667676 RepID=A0A1H7EA78_9BURK|nr:hypothetical protein [Paraburkholderia diazotrophica]SEK10778.1 hypothetical protein SAMN05192539_10498 [Paraburkholderia diazotrophica]
MGAGSDLDTGLAPYAYVDDGGEPHGMALDCIRYLADKPGITFVRERLPDFALTVAFQTSNH